APGTSSTAGRGTPAGTWRACSSSCRPRPPRRPSCLRLRPPGQYIIDPVASGRTLSEETEEDEVARASRGQDRDFGPPLARRRAVRLVVLPRDLARAGRGGAGAAARSGGARRDRLPPRRRADPGRVRP